MQSYWTSILHINNNSFMGPLIIGNFEKQAPGPNCSNAGLRYPGWRNNYPAD